MLFSKFFPKVESIAIDHCLRNVFFTTHHFNLIDQLLWKVILNEKCSKLCICLICCLFRFFVRGIMEGDAYLEGSRKVPEEKNFIIFLVNK